MARKHISDTTQTNLLLKSRRRCCLCFWLEGKDEVVKGQIAHLDQDNSNSKEENLVFLCHDHHDEYDSETRTSKGLKQAEVKKWRDELYKEMQYRFRTVEEKKLQLFVQSLCLVAPTTKFKVAFKLTNVGQCEVSRPVVTIDLPDGIGGKAAYYKGESSGILGGIQVDFRDLDLRGMSEEESDIFKPKGRVAIISPYAPVDPVLLRGQSIDFEGLEIDLLDYPFGNELVLSYRIDAEKMDSFSSELKLNVVPEANWIFEGVTETNIESMPSAKVELYAAIFEAHNTEEK